MSSRRWARTCPRRSNSRPRLLGHAKVVADRLPQCATQGEIHHALDAGVISEADIHAELGDVVIGSKPGREADDEITIADLTGVGVLEAALAELLREHWNTVATASSTTGSREGGAGRGDEDR
jgi:ornithine cyclodeaminase/alanine dehydrogenase-like protein (mu-crystallin family)